MSEYKVKFEVFEGPLDLLLYLIKKEEVDIYEVNLTQIATQFIEYIEVMRMLDLEIAGEFLVMAATLMYIKSKELLPVEQRPLVEEEDEGEDPRWELIRQLVEYKKFKDAAAQLQTLEGLQEEIFPRVPGLVKFEAEEPSNRPQASLFDLINAVNSVLKRVGGSGEEAREIYEERWTVSEKIEHLLKSVADRVSLRFSELFKDAASRTEVVVTFLAVLELIRLRQITAVQTETFGEIEIARAVPGTPAPTPSAPQETAPAEPPATEPSTDDSEEESDQADEEEEEEEYDEDDEDEDEEDDDGEVDDEADGEEVDEDEAEEDDEDEKDDEVTPANTTEEGPAGDSGGSRGSK